MDARLALARLSSGWSRRFEEDENKEGDTEAVGVCGRRCRRPAAPVIRRDSTAWRCMAMDGCPHSRGPPPSSSSARRRTARCCACLEASALPPSLLLGARAWEISGFDPSRNAHAVTGDKVVFFSRRVDITCYCYCIANCPRHSKIRSRSVRPLQKAKRPRRAKPQRRGEERRPRSIGSPPPAPPRPLPPSRSRATRSALPAIATVGA